MNTLTTVNGKSYKVTESNTYYYENTPDKVIDILERARYRGDRIQLFYGDIKNKSELKRILKQTRVI